MSVIADLIRAGVDADLIQRVADELVAAAQGSRSRSKHAEAQARYAERKQSEMIRNDHSDQQGPSPKERSPTPPKEITPTHTSLRSDTARAREIFATEFWPAYPRRRGTNSRDQAEKKFLLLVQQGVDPADMVAGARAYAESRSGEDPQFTKQTVAWLNAGLWKDDYSPMPRARPQRETMGSVMMDILRNANGSNGDGDFGENGNGAISGFLPGIGR